MAHRNFAGKDVAVFGIYPSSNDAECGAADLISAEFPSRDISVLIPDLPSPGPFVRDKSAANDPATPGLLKGALGILSGIGAVVIPGVGPIMAAGPLVSGREGLDDAGDVVAALTGVGMPEYEAKRYEDRIKEGGTLLSVQCDSPNRIKRAIQVLNSSGADDVGAASERRSEPAELV